MTSLQRYKRNLKKLVEKYKPLQILEIGVGKGVSTKVFLMEGIKTISVDIELDMDTHARLIRDRRWEFIQGDVSKVIQGMEKMFSLIYLDAFYTTERLEHDVPLLWEMLNRGGALVFNEYIDVLNQRGGEIREFVHKWAMKNDLDYYVMPNRNGFAVVEKK